MGSILRFDDISVIPNFIDRALCQEVIDLCMKEDNSEINFNMPHYETPNLMHQFKFKLQDRADDVLLRVFGLMKSKWEDVGGVKTDWSDKKLRPQVIHYPRGGGFFGKHSHPLEPQKFGLVLSLTDGAGTTFHLEQGDLHTERKAGDLTLFKYDIPHSVPMVEPDAPLEFFRSSGRWVAILPFY